MELINDKEWNRLYDLGVIDSEEYKLDHRFQVNKLLQEIISKDKFLNRLLFDSVVYPLNVLPSIHHGRKKTLRELDIGKIEPRLDHYQVIQFNPEWSNIEGIDAVKGIFSFPYYDITWHVNFIKELGELWEAYIINPLFLQYNNSCVGIFYMLKNIHNDDLINDLNGYWIKLTGYPLFFKPTLEEIEEIQPITLDLSRKNFIKGFMKENPPVEDIMFYKLLEFWAENECVTVEGFNSSYNKYLDNISHSLWIGFNLKTITSTKPFEFINTRTGEKLGPFTYFEYDPSFDCYYTKGINGKHEINPEIKEDFSKGNYDIRLL